jgi:acyl-CoA synthetase (AMP-forming)/AMP-acid ligase II
MTTRSGSSRSMRDTFPREATGFRTAAWLGGVPSFGERLDLFSQSTVEALQRAALFEGVGVRFYPDDPDVPVQSLSYKKLLSRVRRAAAAMAREGVNAGDRVLLVLPTSLDFLIAFFGVQWLGAIPVPSYPPAPLEPVQGAIDRLAHVMIHSKARFAVTEPALCEALGRAGPTEHPLRKVFMTEELHGDESAELSSAVGADSPCFIQYTSGSTGRPKGVLLTHRNIVSNIHAIGLGLQYRRSDSNASWLPLHHDMGLIGGVLTSVYWTIPLALLSPTAFLVSPIRWLRMIQDDGCTISAAPNFAYGLCAKRIAPEERASLDLSRWRVALNGAEPVNALTVRAFCEAFRGAGFSPEAMFPAYGLAEASLAVCFPRPGAPLRSCSLNRSALADGYVVPEESDTAVHVVCVGQPVAAHDVLLVDENGSIVGENEVGHVVVKGPAVMAGYYRDPEATDSVLRDGFLWTGDLGFRNKDGFYITGRVKDLIIVRGKNYYAEDIESRVEAIEGVRPGGVVAFALYDETRARDLVVCVCETKVQGEAARARLVEAIRESVSDHFGLAMEEVVLVAPGTIPKTSSGKRQRSLTRDAYTKQHRPPRG